MFAAARDIIAQFGPPQSAMPAAAPPRHPAITPLAIPVIVTPWGVTAILFFADGAWEDSNTMATVIALLLLVMLLNLVGMLLAKPIIQGVGVLTFQVVGWIFAVLQAGFAVDAVVTSLRHLAFLHSMT